MLGCEVTLDETMKNFLVTYWIRMGVELISPAVAEMNDDHLLTRCKENGKHMPHLFALYVY